MEMIMARYCTVSYLIETRATRRMARYTYLSAAVEKAARAGHHFGGESRRESFFY